MSDKEVTFRRVGIQRAASDDEDGNATDKEKEAEQVNTAEKEGGVICSQQHIHMQVIEDRIYMKDTTYICMC